MRLLKLGIYGETYLREFNNKRPLLSKEPYPVQHAELIGDCFGSSDFWTQALAQLGYETAEIIANSRYLQAKWAEENDLSFRKNEWIFDISAAQIKKFRPDVLLVADYSTFSADFLKSIRQTCPSIRLIAGWCGAPYFDSSVFSEWDIALSCVPELVADFRSNGHKSFHVNHAFAPQILEKLDPVSKPTFDFVFSGSVLKINNFHQEREHLLNYLVENTSIRIWSDLKRPSLRQRQSGFVRRSAFDAVTTARNAGVSNKMLNRLPWARKAAAWKSRPTMEQFVDDRIVERAQAGTYGLDMFQKLHESRVVFNNHIDISTSSASNMRLFEATGVGACLLTDWKENITALFEPDKEVLTYRSAEECVEKLNYILDHEQERRRIAAAAQQRTLSEHNFDNRAAEINKIIRGAI